MAHPTQRIALGDLNVDQQNFRIGEFDSPRDAYRAMVEDQEDNLVNLAEDILEHGLSPAEPLMVGPDPDHKGQYIVFEGNRRITALKFLHTPALSSGTKWHSDFVRLAKEFAKKPINHIDAVVFATKEDALIWIARKHDHLGGRGIDPWSSPAKHRYRVHQEGVHRPSIAVIDHLTSAGMLDDPLRKALMQKTTNVDRVFKMPYFRETLGVTFADDGSVSFANGNTKQGWSLLLDMLRVLGDKKFSVDKIKTKEQRKDVIHDFIDRSVAAPTESAGKNAPARKTAPSPATRNQPKPSDAKHRITLAPRAKDVTLPIVDTRLAELYREARDLDTDRFPAAAVILFRVFLELSTDYYLRSLKVQLPQKYQGKKWTDGNITLKEKIRAALKHLDPNDADAHLKLARQGLSDPDRMHAIEELHAFVHGLNVDIVGKEVRQIWDRWHNYLALAHKALADAGF